MRKYVSEKASQISKSQTLAISAQAKKMREEGMSIIGFTAGEPDCNTPEYIIDAAKLLLMRVKQNTLLPQERKL